MRLQIARFENRLSTEFSYFEELSPAYIGMYAHFPYQQKFRQTPLVDQTNENVAFY